MHCKCILSDIRSSIDLIDFTGFYRNARQRYSKFVHYSTNSSFKCGRPTQPISNIGGLASQNGTFYRQSAPLIDAVHKSLYIGFMKRRDLEAELRRYGWWEAGGTKHARWTNGEQSQPVPRHNEINEFTAKSILRVAKNNPGLGAKL